MDQHPEPPPVAYRAFIVNEHGRLSGVPKIIVAKDDRDAARQAEHLAEWSPMELWEGARLVARVAAQMQMRQSLRP